MKKYRIVEINNYDKTVYNVEEKFLGFWWKVPYKTYSFVEFYDFEYFNEAVKFIFKKTYKPTKRTLIHVDIKHEKYSIH